MAESNRRWKPRKIQKQPPMVDRRKEPGKGRKWGKYREFRILTNIIGLDKAMELVRSLGGQYIYVPPIEYFMREHRNDRIRKDFDNGNYQELAQRYGLSVEWVKEILQGEYD